MLETGQQQMGRPVEIEFACNLKPNLTSSDSEKGDIYWLQIRPMVDRREMATDIVEEMNSPSVLLNSHKALGHGVFSDVKTIVIVKEEKFSVANNWQIASEIEKINRNFTETSQTYVLVGVGRWGSSDSALGIPVKWAQISAAQLLVEVATPDCSIEPSQGTHFFQNLTSMGVGYFATNPRQGDVVRWDLMRQSAAQVSETENLYIFEFSQPLQIKINGLKGEGILALHDDETTKKI